MSKFKYLSLFILICSIYWIFYLPGPRVATDYHTSLPENLTMNIFPYTWKEINVADGLGEFTNDSLWSQPLHTIFASLAFLKIPFDIYTKILGLIILFLGFYSINKLLKFYKLGYVGIAVGTLFFLTNSFFILMFDGGQLSLNLLYGVLPISLFYFFKIFNELRSKDTLFFILSLIIISFLDIRFLFLIGIIFLIYFLFNIFLTPKEAVKYIKNLLVIFIFSTISLIFFHAYWLLPSFFTRLPSLPQNYGRINQIDLLSLSDIGHAIFLQQPHWFENVFGKVFPLNSEFILIPILIFLGPILVKKNKKVGFWLVIALVGIFLSKGSQEPLSKIYPWLFTHIPFFSFFRDPVKFFFLIALSYSILIAISVDAISKIKFKNIFLKKIVKITPILIIVYLCFLVRPVFLGKMTGLLSAPLYEDEFILLNNILKKDTSFSRVFWIPTTALLGFVSNNHPSVQALQLSQRRPFAIGNIGLYEKFNFLRETPYIEEIFDVSGIGYIAYPFLDPRRDDMSKDNIKYFDTFLDQLSNLKWLSKIDESKIPLFKVNNHQDKFFLTQNIWWIIGSDEIYSEATKSATLKLSKNSLIFAEETAGLGKRLDDLAQAKIVLNNKTIVDLAASFIKPQTLIFPAKNLDFEPNETGWWKRETSDLIRWRDFLQSKYGISNTDFDLGGGWAVAEGDLKLKMNSLPLAEKNEKLKQNKLLLARVLESSRSGQLNFFQNDELVGQIETKNRGNNVRWFEVGELPKNRGELKIVSTGDINVVNALAIIDNNEWSYYLKKAEQLKGSIVEFNELNAENIDKYEVSYQKINPTKYRVNISGLKKPSLLVFSQNYDSLWRMNSQASLPVYGLLNGFKVEKDGQYEVSFEAQKYVYPGLIVGMVMLVVFFYLSKI